MKLFLLIFLSCVFQQVALSQSNLLVRSTTGISGNSNSVTYGEDTYVIQQSIGQTSAIGTFSNGTYTLRQGFIQPNVLSKIVDKNIPLNLGVSVYPNPFVADLTLTFNEDVSGTVKVSLYDIFGRLISEKKYLADKVITINFSDLQIASYIIKVNANNKQFVKKIIKK
ncbi:T9SS type A sorting domain-containing protein [Mariniflexile soesokkakense]|uniref:T9SS type A sorting domain-containing protein n=1 Tax=Mariniflexile soesokkakense TaxID=1343160 RepID=A0ABV0AHI6_9FLAO